MRIRLKRSRGMAEALSAALILLGTAAVGCKPEEEGKMGKLEVAAMTVSSPAFQHRGAIPKEFTADGDNVSPPLHWPDVPDGTKSIALVCEDPDAPRGTFVHWVIFNIGPETRELPRGVPASAKLAYGALQGKNDLGKIGYAGPAPPRGRPHRYFFRLYALDAMLDLEGGATRGQLSGAIEGHVLAEGEIMGTYGR